MAKKEEKILPKPDLTRFIKLDDKKTQYHLIPSECLADVADILTFGAEKYGEGNWKKCDNINRYYDALMRHLEAWRNGRHYDDETRKHHLAHAATNAIFLLYLEKYNGKR